MSTAFTVNVKTLKLAMAEVVTYLDSWPDDDWTVIEPGFDLNLCYIGGRMIATLYPVVEGRVDTSRSIRIFDLYDVFLRSKAND